MATIVTGGAGFVGSHLVERLLAQDKTVVVIDSLWTGSRENIQKFRNNKNFRFIKSVISDERAYLDALIYPDHYLHISNGQLTCVENSCDVRDELPAIEGVSEIYQLACPASPDRFIQSPIEILETCFTGTKNMLDLATRTGARILIASTSESEIYGDPKISPQPEEYWGNTNSFGPRSCYDEGKRITEALAYGYQQKHGLDIRIARIFNAYGPSMQVNDGRAVPNFIAAAIEGRPISIYGDGSATRCFQYVSDCVDGLVRLMQSNYRRPMNIGSNVETRIEDIANVIAELVALKMGKPSREPLQYLPARQDDPYRRKPDISLANAVLGWQPSVGLREGLNATVEWFLDKRRNETNGFNGLNAYPRVSHRLDD